MTDCEAGCVMLREKKNDGETRERDWDERMHMVSLALLSPCPSLSFPPSFALFLTLSMHSIAASLLPG